MYSNVPVCEELLLARQAVAKRMDQQIEEYNARKRKSLEMSAAGDSNVVNAEPGAGGHGGGVGNDKSPAPSAVDDSDCKIVHAEPGAGGHGGGLPLPAPPASSEEHDSDCEIVEPPKRQKRTHVPGTKLCLSDPHSDVGADLELPRLVVDVSGGKKIMIEVETEIALWRLDFYWSKDKIHCEFGTETTRTITIEAKDGARFEKNPEEVQVQLKPTGMIIGTVLVRNHTQALPHSSQKSAHIDPDTHLAILGLPDDASGSA